MAPSPASTQAVVQAAPRFWTQLSSSRISYIDMGVILIATCRLWNSGGAGL